MIDDQVTKETKREMDASSGYLKFHFGDKTWLSDTPALGKIEDSDTAPEATATAVMKKPALCKKPVLPRQKVDAKNIYSRAYHVAREKYKKDCVSRGAKVDANKMKEVSQKAGRLAVMQAKNHDFAREKSKGKRFFK